MAEEHWERLKELFEGALACESVQEQNEFLTSSCGDEPALRAELESLLREHRRMSASFLEPLLPDPLGPLNSPQAGSLVGPYRLDRQLGRGGMGTVFLASRADGAYEKQVAIKFLSAAGSSDELVRRFLAERQILARLDHPNIARLVDGGTTEHGQPYLVMDYVDGIPIDRYCRERSLPLEERLGLFARVCDAVAYAHENLVVHRDIKPGNILVTADRTPKLLDFGIAKLLQPDSGDSEAHRTMLVFGTPEYSSPEQVRGLVITKATDVYSLGVLLYELLTDRSPYPVVTRAAHEMGRIICEQEPEPPSRAISHSAPRLDTGREGARPGPDDRKRRKGLRGDLDNIVMLALRKEPEQRYQSVAEFSEDLCRHAHGLPVKARGRKWTYRAAKFVRRRRMALGAAVLVAVTLVATVGVIRQWNSGQRTEMENRRLRTGRADSVSPDGRLLSYTDYPGGVLTIYDLQNGKQRHLTKNAADGSPAPLSSLFSPDGQWLAYSVGRAGAREPGELRMIRANGREQRTVFRDSETSMLTAHAWTDAQHVLVSTERMSSTSLLLVSIGDGSSRAVADLSRWNESRIMLSPDSRYAAYTAKREDVLKTEVRVVSLRGGADSPLLAEPSDDSVLGWAPDGGRIVFRSDRAGLGAYDIWWAPVVDGRNVGTPARFGPCPDLFKSLGMTRQGSLLYASSNDSDEVFLSEIDSASGRIMAPRVLSGRFAGTKTTPVWSPDGSTVLFVAGDALQFHTLSSGMEREFKPSLSNLRRVIGWRPDGRSVFEYAKGGVVGLFRVDLENGESHEILKGRMDDVALSPDGETVYMQGGPEARSIVARNLSTGEQRILSTFPRRSDALNLRLTLSPDRRMLALQLWDFPAGSNSVAVMPASGGDPRILLQVRRPEMFAVGAIDWSPDSRYLYAGRTSGLFVMGLGFDDRSEIVKIPVDGGGAETIGLSVDGVLRHLHVSPDGRRVVFQTHRSTGEIWVLENFLPAPRPPSGKTGMPYSTGPQF
jgi:serine/threonine protein kinase/Tol biopolymer transport system component